MGKYLTSSPSQTQKLGEILAKEILKTVPKKTAFIIGLEGDLGGGKTTFLQGFAKGLGIKQKITSPTFVIMKRFQLNNLTIKQFNNFYHIDCYRIKKPKEILDLDFKEIISNPKNIVAIEWSDRVRKILPGGTLILKFQFVGPRKRKILIKIKK
jgi:tRNA threonylcarbamoyladenosine biosynthesis protein TsaE